MNRKRLERSVNIRRLLGLGQTLCCSLSLLSSSLSCMSLFFVLFLCLSLSGYLFPDLKEQTVMQTDVLWGVKLHIQLLLSVTQLHNNLTYSN